MNHMPLVGAAIFAVLGMIHLVYTLHDFGADPRFFLPNDKTLFEAMRKSRTRIAPGGRDYWSGVLGFNLSHSIGVLLFALLIVLATLHNIAWLQPLLVLTGVIYATISYRCWFRIPTTGILIATGIIGAGWWA